MDTLVRARHMIHDSPLARTDDSVPKGTVGVVVDVDQSDGWWYVEFGSHDAIAVDPDEVDVIRGTSDDNSKQISEPFGKWSITSAPNVTRRLHSGTHY